MRLLPSTLAGRLAWIIAGLAGAAATTLAVAVSASLLREHDRGFDERLLQLGRTLSQSGLHLDDRLLGWATRITQDELAVVQRDSVIAATLAPAARPALLATLQATYGRAAARSLAPVPLRLGTRTYRAAVLPLARGDPGGTPWLVALAPAEPLQRARRQVWLTAAAATLATTLLGVVAARGAARWVARPVEQLVRATDRLAAGDLDARITPEGPREIARIGAAFNQLGASLLTSGASLRQAERLAAVGRMAASVAHEVRNPLSAMRLSAQLVATQAALAPQQRAAVDTIIDEIDRLELVVAGLLDRAGPRAVQPRAASLDAVIAPVARLLEPRLLHQGIALRVRLDPGLPTLPLDVAALKQVVYNLVLNAAEETRAGGTIAIEAHSSSDGVALAVHDDGPGFTAEALQRAFEPFFTTKLEGFGLGLANARMVVEGHKGRIAVANRPGGGASVTVWLPTRPPE